MRDLIFFLQGHWKCFYANSKDCDAYLYFDGNVAFETFNFNPNSSEGNRWCVRRMSVIRGGGDSVLVEYSKNKKHLIRLKVSENNLDRFYPVSYTHLRAHETEADLVCRLLLEKKK